MVLRKYKLGEYVKWENEWLNKFCIVKNGKCKLVKEIEVKENLWINNRKTKKYSV